MMCEDMVVDFLVSFFYINAFLFLSLPISKNIKIRIMQLSEQEVVRREKLDKLRALNINPYPADLYPVDNNSKEIKAKYEEGKKVVIAGRLMSRRIQGKASFAELQDSEGRIQVYFNRDEICTGEDKALYNDVYKKLLDLSLIHI